METAIKNEELKLNPDQEKALDALMGEENIFLTGAAGSGKSFLIKHYLKESGKPTPIVASTGAAAVIVGGCTFHSFFGLGIMKGGLEKTIAKALKDKRLLTRLKNTDEIIIDEISMIDPEAFYAAEQICRLSLNLDKIFGGIRIIAVGDFFQLPPVQTKRQNFWLFETNVWSEMNFTQICLEQIMRTTDESFIQMLNEVRYGRCDGKVEDYFKSKTLKNIQNFEGTVLFGKRVDVERFNNQKLDAINEPEFVYDSEVKIKKKSPLTHDKVLQISPLPEELRLKKGALIMIRKNHAFGYYVNGTLAHVTYLDDESVTVKTFEGRHLVFQKEEFEILNADGELSATIKNLPLSLAWASTIHKAQGASIDRVFVDLAGLWERGQAYVALSRAKSAEGLFVNNWNSRYIKTDLKVSYFYENMN